LRCSSFLTCEFVPPCPLVLPLTHSP
jgi:hypothetical protein